MNDYVERIQAAQRAERERRDAIKSKAEEADRAQKQRWDDLSDILTRRVEPLVSSAYEAFRDQGLPARPVTPRPNRPYPETGIQLTEKHAREISVRVIADREGFSVDLNCAGIVTSKAATDVNIKEVFDDAIDKMLAFWFKQQG